MDEYCTECGAKLKENAQFCSKCGNRINSHLCPNCGENIEGSENFCESCGWRLTEKESVLKNRKLLIIPVVIIVVIVTLFVGQTIVNHTVEKQSVSVEDIILRIPADFKLNNAKSDNETLSEVNKYWDTPDGKYFQVMIVPISSNDDGDVLIASLGGTKETRYDRDGYLNRFEDGGAAFSYNEGKQNVYIMVSEENLLNQIDIPQ